jgi:hypothetical protein
MVLIILGQERSGEKQLGSVGRKGGKKRRKKEKKARVAVLHVAVACR